MYNLNISVLYYKIPLVCSSYSLIHNQERTGTGGVRPTLRKQLYCWNLLEGRKQFLTYEFFSAIVFILSLAVILLRSGEEKK